MSDPQPVPLTNIREEDNLNIPTLPGPSGAINQANAVVQNVNFDEPMPASEAPPSPVIIRQRPRRASSVSRVDVGYFDPSGVDELRRTMSRMSAGAQSEKVKRTKTEQSIGSDTTLGIGGDGPFDFEKTFRIIMKKCVYSADDLREIY